MLPKRETQRHRDAFEDYYSMPKRSLQRVADKYSVSKKSVERWSVAFNWAERIKERDALELEETAKRMAIARAKYNVKKARMGQFLQGRALITLKKEQFKTASEATTGQKIGMEMEGQALGVSDQKIEHHGEFKVIFEDIEADARSESEED